MNAGLLEWIQDLGTKAWNWIQARLLPWARANPKPASVAAAALGVGVITYIGGSILINGMVAGLLISAVFGVLIWKLKKAKHPQLRRAYNELVGHPLGTDVAVSLLALFIAPAGITGWAAAGVAGLVASVWLAGATKVELVEPTELQLATVAPVDAVLASAEELK